MDTQSTRDGRKTACTSLADAIRKTAPGTSLRLALDMILAGHFGALICVGDVDNVLAAGNGGFVLDSSFTADRLFELCKMDGAVVLDRDLTKIVRANFHLSPSNDLSTHDTGIRHRTASRMSLATDALVITISSRRSVIHVYSHGRSFQLKPVGELLAQVNQLTVAMHSIREQLNSILRQLTISELDNYVTLGFLARCIYLFEMLLSAGEELDDCIVQLGKEGHTARMQREGYLADIEDTYLLTLRDYAYDSDPETASKIYQTFRAADKDQVSSLVFVAQTLGYGSEVTEDTVIYSRGLRTLNRISVVQATIADKIANEYGSLREVLDAAHGDSSRLGEIGIEDPSVLAQSLRRMWGRTS